MPVASTMKVIKTLSEKKYSSFLGASACVKLKHYEEATSWCDKGLAVSFNVTYFSIRKVQVMLPVRNL